MEEIFEDLVSKVRADYVEFRRHRKVVTGIRWANGEFEDFSKSVKDGVGIRVLVSGSWGFASTSSLDRAALSEALERAARMARAKGEGGVSLAEARLFRGEFVSPGYSEVLGSDLGEGRELVLSLSKVDRPESVRSLTIGYREMVDERHVWTSDGANARSREGRTELVVMATALEGGESYVRLDGGGVLGSRRILEKKIDVRGLAEKVVSEAASLVRAPRPRGGRYTMILSPSVVGLLAHEAVGHTAEADFVESGSAVSGKLGERVASEIVSLADSGLEMPGNPPGTIVFDDEGVIAGRTYIIKEGVLTGYMTDRERAARLGVPATGNSRAWDHSSAPLIRMRNTYVEPGDWKLEEMVEDMKEGFIIEGGGGGQADSNAEFFFAVQKAIRVERGERKETLRGTAITGQAFEVLSSADAASREWDMAMSTGYCGKIQPAKVAGGGPYLRVVAQLAGVSR